MSRFDGGGPGRLQVVGEGVDQAVDGAWGRGLRGQRVSGGMVGGKLRVGVVTMAVCLLAGCGGGSSAVPGVPSSVLANDDAGLVPGSVLTGYLLQASDVPAGYVPEADLTGNSGSTFRGSQQVEVGDFQTPGAVDYVDGTDKCPLLSTTAFASGLAGPLSAAFAQDAYKDNLGDTVYSEVDSYRPGDAPAVMQNVRSLATRCAKFTDPAHGNAAYQVTASPGPSVGDESITLVETSPGYVGGTTSVVVRIGNLLVMTQDNSLHAKDTGNRATTYADTIAERVKNATHS